MWPSPGGSIRWLPSALERADRRPLAEANDLLGRKSAAVEPGDDVGEAARLAPRGWVGQQLLESRRDLSGRRVSGNNSPHTARRHALRILGIPSLRDAEKRYTRR